MSDKSKAPLVAGLLESLGAPRTREVLERAVAVGAVGDEVGAERIHKNTTRLAPPAVLKSFFTSLFAMASGHSCVHIFLL